MNYAQIIPLLEMTSKSFYSTQKVVTILDRCFINHIVLYYFFLLLFYLFLFYIYIIRKFFVAFEILVLLIKKV